MLRQTNSENQYLYQLSMIDDDEQLSMRKKGEYEKDEV